MLVLDGLPVESYIEKGVLEDLGDMITPMAESGELYPNIAENFTGSDGSVYQFPVRVGIPVIYGNEAVIKEMPAGARQSLMNRRTEAAARFITAPIREVLPVWVITGC